MLFCICGVVYESINQIKYGRGVFLAIAVFLCAEMYLRLRDMIASKFVKRTDKLLDGNNRKYLFYMFVTIVMWLPVFLAYYPGLFTYDVFAQIPQPPYYTQHPLIHTLLLQFFYYEIGEKLTGSYNVGMACYCIIQMLILAAAIAYMHLFLYRMGIGRKARSVLLIYTGIFPVYSVLSISTTKDIIFTAFFLVLFLCLCYWNMAQYFFEERNMQVLYIVSIVGVILFRNNGIYCVILLIAAILVMMRGRDILKLLLWTVVGIVLAFVIHGALKYSTHALNGSKNEMLSVPYQQISYVYNTRYDELSEDEVLQIEKIIPNVNDYRSECADNVKASGTASENKKEFIEIYLRLLKRYPISYTLAFLRNSMGYWYLFDTTNAEIYGYGPEGRKGYMLTDTKSGFNIEHVSYFPALENLYERWFSLNEYQKNPLLFVLCSLALYFWAVVLCIFYAVGLKSKHILLPVTLLLGYGITVFAGPCALVRYAFPIIVCVPPLFAATFKSVF